MAARRAVLAPSSASIPVMSPEVGEAAGVTFRAHQDIGGRVPASFPRMKPDVKFYRITLADQGGAVR